MVLRKEFVPENFVFEPFFEKVFGPEVAVGVEEVRKHCVILPH